MSEYDQREAKHTIMDLAGKLNNDSDEWESIVKTLYEDQNSTI